MNTAQLRALATVINGEANMRPDEHRTLKGKALSRDMMEEVSEALADAAALIMRAATMIDRGDMVGATARLRPVTNKR